MHHSNEDQFKREYEELFRYVSTYISFRVPSKEAAEEIISETFLYAYAKLSYFNSERGSLRQWMTGIAKHKIADHWRYLKPTTSLEDALNFCDEVDHESWSEALDASAKAEEILASLTPEVRALFTLRYVDGLTYKEIADRVRKRPSAIRASFSRALARLRQNYSL